MGCRLPGLTVRSQRYDPAKWSDRSTEDGIMCDEKKASGAPALVADFTVEGFDRKSPSLADAHSRMKDLRALKLSVCVGASYNPGTNEICFEIPIYGKAC